MYILDTNACIRILNNSSTTLLTNLKRHNYEDICLCAMVKAELLYGAQRSGHAAQNLRGLQKFFESFVSLPFDDHSAQEYGRIRNELERRGTPIGPNDMIIAATAIAHDAVLVTHNTREFSRVISLRFEDWELEI